MIKQEKWHLDQNGISVMDATDEQVIDLRNECDVVGLHASQGIITVEFIKTEDLISSQRVHVKERLALEIKNASSYGDLPAAAPAQFEGIYDYSSQQLNLCLGDECYLIRGKGLEISFATLQ